MKTPAQLSEGRRERLEHMAVKSAQQQGEIAALKAENERLREALSQIAVSAAPEDVLPIVDQQSGVRKWISASQFARAALEPK